MKKHFDENRLLHREDGPAAEWNHGTKEWWIHGKLHREDGPAYEWPDGTTKGWWWKGIYKMTTSGDVTEAQIKEFRLRILK